MAPGPKPTKNQLRRAKKKAAKHEVSEDPISSQANAHIAIKGTAEPTPEPSAEPEPLPPTTEATSIQADEEDSVPELDETDPLYEMYKDVMGKFAQEDKEDPSTKEIDKPEIYYSDEDEIPDEEEEGWGAKDVKKEEKRAE